MAPPSSLPLLLLSCLLLAWLGAAVANEADRLNELMRSRWSRRDDLRDRLDAAVYEVSQASSSVYIGPQDGLREADKIGALPGQPHGSKFDQYAGYVTVDPKAGRALFYYFTEAPQPSEKPLVVWLNGGPGCSSLGAGGMLELGPFFVNSDGKTLYKNKHAWNTVANMIFIESPAGVGYSYSNTTSDYKASGDKRTTDDTYTFLINWLERFPEYKGRDFFITGESYAGHYIPELANAIIVRNKMANASIINLKGIAIGNAYLDDATNTKGIFNFYWTHALISNETYQAIVTNCDFINNNGTQLCADAVISSLNEKGTRLDQYNIYAPLCHDSSKSSSPSKRPILVGDPCSDVYVHSYLNQAEVQRALHANTTGLNYTWSDCSDLITPNTWTDAPTSMLPTIKKVMRSGISVWLFSGDIDAVVPVTSTQYSLDDLQLPIITPWRPWYKNDEVAGYVVGYKGLVFATVRGAGHMVPRYQPERALTLFSSFLQGKLPPAYKEA